MQTLLSANTVEVQAEAAKLLKFGRHPRFLTLLGVVLDRRGAPVKMVTELAVCSLDALAGSAVYPGSAPDPRVNAKAFVKKLAKHILQGLVYMHEDGTKHRDIKVSCASKASRCMGWSPAQHALGSLQFVVCHRLAFFAARQYPCV